MPLGMPDDFAETFEYGMQRQVLVAPRNLQAFILRAQSWRLVDRNLLGDGKV